MNNWKPIFVVTVLLAAGATFEIFTLRGRHREFINTTLRSIGSDLSTSTHSSHLVSIGPDLRAQLSELRSAETHVADVLFGDESPPNGNGIAGCRLVLTNDAGRGLLIRLRVADKAGMFQVLGFRTLGKSDL